MPYVFANVHTPLRAVKKYQAYCQGQNRADLIYSVILLLLVALKLLLVGRTFIHLHQGVHLIFIIP